MKVGNIEMPHGLMLAPMAGYSDRGMRAVCHREGAEYSVTEMISAKGVCYGDKKTMILAAIGRDEGDVGLQIFGSDPDIMARAAERLAEGVKGDEFVPPAAIDINMGCPVNKIFSNGEGSALMRDPELIYRIVRSVSAAVSVPVTVKLRAGVDSEHINAVECALAAEEGGAELICLHGRTRVEMYSGVVNMEIIKNVKQRLHIPLIANGDVRSGADAVRMLKYTCADGIAVGRAAVGNPFIFAEIRAALSGEEYTEPTLERRCEVALEQLKLSMLAKGENIAIPEARKQIALYLRDFRGAAGLRARINTATTYAQVEEIFREILLAETNK